MTGPQTALDFTAPVFEPRGELSFDERSVWSLLKQRRGAPNAIRVPDLARAVGLSTRRVQTIVHGLIHEHGVPIGTSMREPFGYYLAASQAERRAVAGLHRRRAAAMLATAAAIEGIDRREYLRRHQTELETGGEAA